MVSKIVVEKILKEVNPDLDPARLSVDRSLQPLGFYATYNDNKTFKAVRPGTTERQVLTELLADVTVEIEEPVAKPRGRPRKQTEGDDVTTRTSGVDQEPSE